MNSKSITILCCSALVLLSACRTNYHLSGIERTRIVIDSKYDKQPDVTVKALMAPYKHAVDSIMSPVVGSTARYLAAHRPESPLSNLLADILVWGAKPYNENIDFAVYNMGGIRAAFAKGTITYGDVVDVAPFENKICFLTLTGEQVKRLFEQMASVGGEGLSNGVQLLITKDGKLKKSLIHGKEIVPTDTYRIATLDYLAQGNDKLEAFKEKTNLNSPQDFHSNVRFIIMDYFKEKAAQGLQVDADEEGRTCVE